MFASRPVPLCLVGIRILVTTLVLLQPLRSDHHRLLSLILDLGLLGWSIIATAAFFVGFPRSKRDFFLLLAVDLLWACWLMARGAPLAATALLIVHGVAWRAAGGGRPGSPTLPAFVILWLAYWLAFPAQADLWLDAQPGHADILKWPILFGSAGLAIWWMERRRSDLEKLGTDNWLGRILSTEQPFAFDFTDWVKEVASLYGENCTGLLCLRSQAGTIQNFAHGALPPDPAGLREAVLRAPGLLPATLSIIADRNRRIARGPGSTRLYQEVPVLLRLDRRVVAARSVALGNRKGFFLLACDMPVDPFLLQELGRIDRSLDAILEQLGSTIEMRRVFVSDAREVARRDLHDGVLQTLAAIRMRLLTIMNVYPMADPACEAEIRTTADIIALEQRRLRGLLDQNSSEDRSVNLVESLKLCAETIALQWEMEIAFMTDEIAIPMHQESAGNIEYLLREIVANAGQHSGAKEMNCTLAIRGTDLVLSVVNMSPDPEPEIAGQDWSDTNPLESQSLRQRLALVNGRAYSEGLNKRTLLAIAIPLVYEGED